MELRRVLVLTVLLVLVSARVLVCSRGAGGLSPEIISVVLVDESNEQAKGFYLHHAFVEPLGHDLDLFLPIETIE